MSSTFEERLRWKWGLSVADYEEMLRAQDGRCAICRTPEPGGPHNAWHVDHDHATGVIRGLLCARCNLGLGYFLDSQEHLTSAVLYLAEPRPDAPVIPDRAPVERRVNCEFCDKPLPPAGERGPVRRLHARCRVASSRRNRASA
jgi:hypothetical protein